jgi:hypothetical protein
MPNSNCTKSIRADATPSVDTDGEAARVTLSKPLAIKLARLLAAFSMPSTYTDGPRTGGVLAGCPRGAKPTAERLATIVRIVREEFNEEIEAQQGFGA